MLQMPVLFIEMQLPCVKVFADQTSSDESIHRECSVTGFGTRGTICMQDFDFPFQIYLRNN